MYLCMYVCVHVCMHIYQEGQSRWQNQAIMGFGKKAAVTNSNIFSLTHTLKSFTDPIRHTDMYIEYI